MKINNLTFNIFTMYILYELHKIGHLKFLRNVKIKFLFFKNKADQKKKP